MREKKIFILLVAAFLAAYWDPFSHSKIRAAGQMPSKEKIKKWLRGSC